MIRGVSGLVFEPQQNAAHEVSPGFIHQRDADTTSMLGLLSGRQGFSTAAVPIDTSNTTC